MAYRLISLDALLAGGAASGPTAERALTAEERDYAAGFKAANDRFAAVIESAAGKANIPAAIFMITETDASAETIIAKLPNLGQAAAPPNAAKASEDPLKLWGEIQGEPAATSDHGPGSAVIVASDRGSDVDSVALWGNVQANPARGSC